MRNIQTIEPKRKCLFCGDEFIPTRSTKLYCSSRCQRLAGKYAEDIIHKTGAQVIRQFNCRMCGADVKVSDKRDKRTVFCTQSCERRYWRHEYLKKRIRSCKCV